MSVANAATGRRVYPPVQSNRLRASAVAHADVLAAGLLAALGGLGLALASAFRHARFGSNAYDLGLYDQSIWGFSRFDLLLDNTVLRVPTLLGNHFSPILVTLAPLLWIWDDARMLLIAQGFLIASAGVPIYLWARDRLGFPAAFAFELAYLGYWAVIAGALYDFHELAFAAPIISLALYAVLTGRNRLLWAMVVLGLLTKENLPLTFAAVGLYVACVQRRWRLGGAIIGACALGFGVIYKLALPAITGAAYAHWFYPELGSGPGSAARHVFLHPVDTLRLLLTPSAKLRALFNLFAPWLVLPLLSPMLIVALPTLAERFLSEKESHWGQGFHYSLVLAPILAFSAIDTTARLTRLVSERIRQALLVTGAAALVLAGIAFTFGRMRPLSELRRYTSAAHAADIEACLATIPGGSSVAATSALVPHLSHRKRIWVLDDRPIPTAQALAIDTYTWTYPLTVPQLEALQRRSLANGYSVACRRPGTVVLLRRGA
jgi:uncharacterized membrane protein